MGPRLAEVAAQVRPDLRENNLLDDALDDGRDDKPDRAHVAGAEVGPALKEVDAEPALELPLAPLGLIK